MIKKFGLIGKNISYSFSQKYFTEKFRELKLPHTYEIFDIPNVEEFETIARIPNLAGLNVTIPYKQLVIPYLDELSPEAEAVGAVNTIKILAGKRTGYNTDVFGFAATLEKHLKPYHRSALIIGNGGAAKAVAYVFKQKQIPYQIVSRRLDLNFENITSQTVSDSQIIVQCTPVGTFPANDESVDFPYEALSEKHLVIDLIYNPAETAFLRKAKSKQAETVNGLLMLEKQADKAWEIWNSPS